MGGRPPSMALLGIAISRGLCPTEEGWAGTAGAPGVPRPCGPSPGRPCREWGLPSQGQLHPQWRSLRLWEENPLSSARPGRLS